MVCRPWMGTPYLCIPSHSKIGKGGGILRPVCCCALRIVEIFSSRTSWNRSVSEPNRDGAWIARHIRTSTGSLFSCVSLLGLVSMMFMPIWEKCPESESDGQITLLHCYIACCICGEYASFDGVNKMSRKKMWQQGPFQLPENPALSRLLVQVLNTLAYIDFMQN